MIAAVCIWGIYSVVVNGQQNNYTTYGNVVLWYFRRYFITAFNIGSFTVSNINTSFITSLLYTGLISTVLCMVFWNIGVQKLGATTSGIFLNFNQFSQPF